MVTGLVGTIFAQVINSVLKTFLARADQRRLARLGIDKEALQNALKGEKWRRDATGSDADLDIVPGAPNIGPPSENTCPKCGTVYRAVSGFNVGVVRDDPR